MITNVRRTPWGPLADLSLQDLRDLPVGALGHLVRLKADPLYRLAQDLPEIAAWIIHEYGDMDFSDPSFDLADLDRDGGFFSFDEDDSLASDLIGDRINTASRNALHSIARSSDSNALRRVTLILSPPFDLDATQ